MSGILELSGLRERSGDVVALDGVDLRAEPMPFRDVFRLARSER